MFQIEWAEDGRLRKTLASWELRDAASIATIDELVRALDELRRRPHCPPLSKDMDDATTIATVRCLVEGTHRTDQACSSNPLRPSPRPSQSLAACP